MNTRNDPYRFDSGLRQLQRDISEISLARGKETATLQLADGQKWDFYFTEDLRGWGQALVSLMRLKRTRTGPGRKLVFSGLLERDGSIQPAVSGIEDCSAMPSFGNQVWSMHAPGPVRIWSASSGSEKVIELLFLETRALRTISMVFSLTPIYHAVIEGGGLPFHAVLIAKSGSGVLLAAPGDGGKSTCAARIPKPWEAMCDDEAMIVRDKDGRYAVHPFPTWSDHLSGRSHKTWDVQCHVPLRAIFFLGQSKEDKIVEISKSQAAASAYKAAEQISLQTFRGLDAAEARRFRQKLFENACSLVTAIPAYVLRASLTGRFWEEMEKVLP